MENSKIEWTDSTANFWWGCVKVSPGCQHCYAESWANRWGKPIWGPAATTEREYKKAAWVDLPKWNAKAKADGVRRRVFVQSMADFFEDHPQVLPWRNQALRLMAECTSLDFQVLTKRPENIMQMIPTDWRPHKWGSVPDHIWIGTSVENQETADKRIPALLKVPAKTRFLSCEPLLGPVNLVMTTAPFDSAVCEPGKRPVLGTTLDGIHWVIAGGESGPNARPMHPDWARSLRNQCVDARVPFLFKQHGEWLPVAAQYGDDDFTWKVDPYTNRHIQCLGNDGYVFSDNHDWDCGFQPYPSSNPWFMAKVGKHAAGRLLDGVEWNQFPA